MANKEELGLVKNLLENSYKKPQAQAREVNGYFRDDSLSGQRAQVYYNPETKKTIVTHRGTASPQDVLTDVKLLFGNKTNERFKYGKNIQKQAEAKYGAENVTTAGHSLGGSIAERVGKKSEKIITLNKPVTPFDVAYTKVSGKQQDVKTSNDPVSILRRFQKGRRQKVIQGPRDPIEAHKLSGIRF
jgi:hypothetical protein